MKNVKMLGLAALALGVPALFGVRALAAQAAAPGAGHGLWARAASQLNLSDSQKAQIKSILQSARLQAQSIRGDSALSADQKRTKLAALRQSTRDRVKQALTPDQQKRAARMLAARRARTGAVALGALANRLNLTADEKARIKPILRSAAAQAKAIRADKSLTADQRRAKLLAVRQSVKDQVGKLLTPDQRQKLGALRARLRQRMARAR